MKNKDTQELVNELQSCKSYDKFLNNNLSELQDLSVSNYLVELLIRYNAEKSVIISRSHIPESYGYQIFEGRRNPGRDKLIQLAFAFPLTPEDTNHLLRAGNFGELYVRNKRDSLILFCLVQKYDIMKTNELLEQYQEQLLG